MILADLRDYLADQPQLVRWSGFDEADLQAFRALAEDPNSTSDSVDRLRKRFFGFLEVIFDGENAGEKTYEVSSRRFEDWDVQVAGLKPIGNVGMALWEGSRCPAVKWALGWHVQESRDLLEIDDLRDQGSQACLALGLALAAVQGMSGVEVEFRAGQRFQFANGVDGTWAEPGPTLGLGGAGDGDALGAELSERWESELDLFQEVAARDGDLVPAAEALEVKRAFLLRRNPNRLVERDVMATRHQEWRLYPVFDSFFWLKPEAFMLADEGETVLSKEDQLERLGDLVRIMAEFACAVSR